MAAGNSVDARYTLDRKELTDYNKIILRNTEISSIPNEIASLLIVCARKHKFSCLSVGPQQSHPAGKERHLHCCSKDHNVSPPSHSLKRLLELLRPIAKSCVCTVLIQCDAILLYRLQDFCSSVQHQTKLLLASDSLDPEICLTQEQRFGQKNPLAENVHGDIG